MEITVTVEQILEPQSFTKRDGTEIVRNAFVGKTNGQYPKHVKFDVINKDLFERMNIVVGYEYIVSFDVESREWNGKWFSSISAWKAVCVKGVQPVNAAPHPQPQVPNPAHAPVAAEENKGDVPF